MSHSVKPSTSKSITQNQLVRDLCERTSISETTIRRLLQELPDYIMEQFEQGNSVRVANLCTFHLRRRDYDEHRRKSFHMSPNATLPEFCYYPFASFSVPFRQRIADKKDTIAQSLKSNISHG